MISSYKKYKVIRIACLMINLDNLGLSMLKIDSS